MLRLLVVACASIPNIAQAHVKWFCGPVDLAASPVAFHSVISWLFLESASLFLLLVAGGALLDALLIRFWSRQWFNFQSDSLESWLIRVATGLYAVFLWNNTAVAPWATDLAGAILTPELLHRDDLLNYIQLLVAVFVLSRRTAPLAAIGLTVLYFIGVIRYGLYHMVDYVYFLGIAAYVAIDSSYCRNRSGLLRWKIPIIAWSLAFSLMWTAIEKFLYPEWTAIIVAAHPNLAFGFSTQFVTVIAGFVEFSLAFYLLVGRWLLRVGAVIYGLVFVLAIPEFGTLDSVGHLPIIAVLLVVALHGARPVGERYMWPLNSHPVYFAGWVAGFYVCALALMMSMYYGLQLTAATS